MVANAHSFRSIGAQRLGDWLADQQQTYLLATGRESWVGSQSSHITPSLKKTDYSPFNYQQGFEWETQVRKMNMWIKQQQRLRTKQQILSLYRLRDSRESWSILGIGQGGFGESFVFPLTTIRLKTNSTEQINTVQQMRNSEHVSLVWTGLWGKGKRGGLTLECTVHNPLIQICKKIAL